MTSTTTLSAVDAFAARVRELLSDLPRDEVDDLTDGLEADLAEKALDEELGDPETYAEELRSAAGLPPRNDSTGAELRLRWTRFVARLRADPFWSKVLGFAVALRPVWWVARGWAVWVALGFAGTDGPLKFLPLAAVVVVSVQWGRGKWLPGRVLRVAKIVVSVIAVIALPFAIGASLGAQNAVRYSDDDYFPPQGIQLDGNEVNNIFAYDADGEPLSDVQLFDQDGKPLSLLGDGDNAYHLSDGSALVPNPAVTGGSGWNVYPLQSSAVDPMTGEPDRGTTPQAVQPPFPRVQPLVTQGERDGYTVTSPAEDPAVKDPLPTP